MRENSIWREYEGCQEETLKKSRETDRLLHLFDSSHHTKNELLITINTNLPTMDGEMDSSVLPLWGKGWTSRISWPLALTVN